MGPLHARGPVGQRHYAGGEFSIGALNSELAGAHSYCRFWAWPKTLPDLELENARFWPISKGWIDPAVTYGFRPGERHSTPGGAYAESPFAPACCRVWR